MRQVCSNGSSLFSSCQWHAEEIVQTAMRQLRCHEAQVGAQKNENEIKNHAARYSDCSKLNEIYNCH